jgi:FkbM family methyltransferase
MLGFHYLQKYLRYLRISRSYFRNWFSVYLKYFLCRRGLLKVRALDVKCKDDSLLTLSPDLYGLLLSGLFNGLFKDLRCRDKAVVTRDSTIPFQEILISESLFDALRHRWRYDESYGYWFKNDVKFRHMRHYILEVFDYEEYRYTDVGNRVVVDVGAGYGETAIYFLKKGARHVIAIEPCPHAYEEMLENLKLNGVEDKVTPINAGLSSVRNNVNIECPMKKIIANTITLGDIAKEFDVRGGVLKMDCEGCEYDVILNDYEHVKVFDEVYFEYHAFITKIPVDMLLKKLSKDFMCRIVSDDEFYRRHGFNKKLLGLIKCVKK